VKGKGFVLIFSPKPVEILTAVGLCAVLCGAVLMFRQRKIRLDAAMQGRSSKEAIVSTEATNRFSG
jgi:hypothetical protein